MVAGRYKANFVDPASTICLDYDRKDLRRPTFQRARVRCRRLLKTQRCRSYRHLDLYNC